MDRDAVKKKCVDIMRDRIVGVNNDLKAFIYIRKNNLQHKEEDIGGGNIVVALSLFTAINFLAKCYYCTVRPDKFNPEGHAEDETACFIAFMRYLQTQGLQLNLPRDGDVLGLVWNGFRNYLAHRLTVEPGKSVISFTFEPENTGTIDEILSKANSHPVFEHDGNSRNWRVNGDVLLAKLIPITEVTASHIINSEEMDERLLVKVLDIEV